MKKFALVALGILSAATVARASDIVSYTATAAPGQTPDGVDQNNNPVSVWTQTVTPGTPGSGGAGSYIYNGWEIYSYPDQTGPSITEDHTFTGGALAVGQDVSISFSNSAIQAGQAVGINLLDGTTPVISFSFTGGDTSGNYRYTDASTTGGVTGLSFEYQTNFPVSFTLTGASTYTATAGATGDWSGTYAGPITGIEVFNDAAGNSSDTAFNDLSVSAAAVPEPMSLSLIGLVGAGSLIRRRK